MQEALNAKRKAERIAQRKAERKREEDDKKRMEKIEEARNGRLASIQQFLREKSKKQEKVKETQRR